MKTIYYIVLNEKQYIDWKTNIWMIRKNEYIRMKNNWLIDLTQTFSLKKEMRVKLEKQSCTSSFRFHSQPRVFFRHVRSHRSLLNDTKPTNLHEWRVGARNSWGISILMDRLLQRAVGKFIRRGRTFAVS